MKSSIFRPEVLKEFGITITEASLEGMEDLLRQECKFNGMSYTRQYLKTIISSTERFIKLGMIQGNIQQFCGAQVSFVMHVEELLRRFELKIASQLPSDENLLQ